MSEIVKVGDKVKNKQKDYKLPKIMRERHFQAIGTILIVEGPRVEIRWQSPDETVYYHSMHNMRDGYSPTLENLGLLKYEEVNHE